MVVMEVAVHEIIFQTKLLKDGHLHCPKEYAKIWENLGTVRANVAMLL